MFLTILIFFIKELKSGNIDKKSITIGYTTKINYVNFDFGFASLDSELGIKLMELINEHRAKLVNEIKNFTKEVQ